jgi:hypothetical protein
MVLACVLFVIGLLMLYYGAEWLVKGASSLARSLGLTPLVIGLTVVAFGTSAPELVVSIISSFQEKSMIAVGNVVGSNICNIALVLGLASLFMPIKSNESVVKRDIPIMLGISLYLMLISLNSTIGRLEGATLLCGIIIYVCLNYYYAVKGTKQASSREKFSKELAAEDVEHIPSRARQIALIVAGILFVVAGAQVLIDSAVKIMHTFGISEKFIGLTVVALGTSLPELLGGKKAYSPAFYSTGIFIVSILIGMGAGLITGCIGAGGGFIIAPALMSAGIKGILAVGTDLFHIFAKAIMGSVIHRKLGNVSVPLAIVFLIGAIIGATAGGVLNRVLYEINPVLSDAFITTVYSLMLGFLGTYALIDFLKARKAPGTADEGAHGGKSEGADMGGLPKKLQAVKIPPLVKFDFDLVPGGRGISWVFLVLSGALVGLAAGIMGVGGGFLTFPIFVYVLGVSSMTTVGTDIFQIVFTAGYASISQYAIYGFIFYTLAMGMLLGSLLGIQVGALVTKVVPGITIRGFYAMAVLAGFINRIFALPAKLNAMDVIKIDPGTASVLESIGVWAFFIVIGVFSVWVIGTFLTNIPKLKGEEV